MRSAAEFGEFLANSSYSGKIGLVVKFPIKPGKEADFEKEFRPVQNVSVKEKGCIKERIFMFETIFEEIMKKKTTKKSLNQT